MRPYVIFYDRRDPPETIIDRIWVPNDVELREFTKSLCWKPLPMGHPDTARLHFICAAEKLIAQYKNSINSIK